MRLYRAKAAADKAGVKRLVENSLLPRCFFTFNVVLSVLFFVLLVIPGFAINAPTVTHVATKVVIPETTMYSASKAFEIKGNAEAYTQIRLFRDSTQIATGTASVAGVWAINLTNQPEGSAQYSALAVSADGVFVSELCVAVPVIVDVTLPSISIWYGNSGCRSNCKYQCGVGLYYSTVSDAHSGIDFSSGQYVVDYAAMPTEGDPDSYTPSWQPCPGTVTNDNSKQINFYPTDWNLLNQSYRKIRITASVSDKAGNSVTAVKSFYMHKTRAPAPTITHIKDGDTWVPYTSGMTVQHNPVVVRGRVDKWNVVDRGWYAAYVTDINYNRHRIYSIDQSTGIFDLSFADAFPEGNISFRVGAGESSECLGWNAATVNIVTLVGSPYPVVSISPYNGGDAQIFGSRLWPDFTGKIIKMSSPQTVQIGWGDLYSNTFWPSLSQVVLPQGQHTTGVSNIYNEGDVWYDANNNGAWDAGEIFHDMPASTSDGESFSLVNFRGLEFAQNGCQTIGMITRNTYGKSSSKRVVRDHHNDTYSPLLNGVVVEPVHDYPYRNASVKPTQLVIKAQTWAGDYSGSRSWSDKYNLVTANSTVRLVNGRGETVANFTPAWTPLGKLAYEGKVDLSSTNLPDGTYHIHVRLEDNMRMVTEDSSNWFVIDNAAPKLSEVVPADGALSNAFTSFSAKVVDDDLPDLTAGSGANIDVAKPQIWPYKVLTLQETCGSTNAVMAFDLSDGLSSPIDHQGVAIPRYAAVKIFEVIGGVYQPVVLDGTIDEIKYKKIEVRLDSKFQDGKTYKIMYAVPFFTSNNGYDRVGAVPVSPITADGTYVSRILVCDKAGNEGTFDFKSSPLEVARGTITYTFDKPFLFAGLTPRDTGWFTTSAVTTSKGNPVSDGQQLSLVQTPNNLTVLTPADANGIPGDGHQVLFGANGAPVGAGVAKFGVEVLTASPGSMSVYGVIALANGTSAAVPIYLIDPFALTSGASIIDITSGNPSPTVTISTGYLGISPRPVPDNTIAECSTNFGSLTGDADLTMPGVQSKAISGAASIVVTSATKGDATVTMSMGGRSANTIVTFRDRYPPPAPTNLTLTPQYSNTGSAMLTWTASSDIGGAGTARYFVEQSANNGTTWAAIQTVTTNSCLVSGLVSGSYRFRVKAQDNDNNTGAYSAMSISLVVDTVAPVAVACSDIGAGNNDPDEQYSSDAQIYFYFTPTDERSGVGDVQIQISTAADISGLVAEPWVGPTSPYLFPDGEAMKTYYARVRVKDKAGNVGEWGSWSNGIMVVLSGAVTPPNAPTIAKVADKNAVPGVPLPINITSSIKVEGMSEASNLISVYVDNVYKQSVISDSNGNFQTFISLTTGTHAVKVRAHNGFAESAFSNTITIVVDQTKPEISRVVYDSSGFTRGGQYFGTTASDHNLATFDFYLSDEGGGGFDISSFNAVMTEIEDDGDLVSAVAPYKNPVTSSVEVIAADRVRLLPDGAWKNCLQTGHRYRMAYEVSDFAGNKTTATFDFVIDNTKPGKAAEVPVDTVPLSCNIKNIYVYDYEKYPSGYPPAEALVPYKWDTSANAFMIDPAFNDDALVDKTTTPPALKFNTLALYGTLYAANSAAPAPQKGFDSLSSSLNIAWGYGSGITMGPDGLGNYKSFKFPFRTVTNGLTQQTLVDQDRAVCRNSFTIRFWVNSGDPAPSAPLSVQFCNAADQAVVYPVWTSYGDLFGSSG
ncbi:MAG: hypothetical protein EOM80_13700, partial [Erysipelotrichia bacterium]|nr:hypothetical protein [Erysipelotrichia bacterium]